MGALLDRVKRLLTQNQIMIVFLALLAGFLFPRVFRPLAPLGTPLLMLIFFTSSLRLSLHELRGYAGDWKMAILTTFFMLIFLPVVMWLPPHFFAPDWELPFLIVGAMPTGMTIALIAEYFGGKTTLALVITAITSLAAPFTIPLVFFVLIGKSVPIPTLKLFGDLFFSIVLPFAAAAVAQNHAKKFIKRHDNLWRNISVIAFGLLVASIVADTTGGTTIVLGWGEVGILVVMLVYMAGLTVLAYKMAWWRTPGERATIALCMVYMNNTLALFVGNRYFPEHNIVPRLVIILLVVNALLPFVRILAKRAAVTLAKPKTRHRHFNLP